MNTINMQVNIKKESYVNYCLLVAEEMSIFSLLCKMTDNDMGYEIVKNKWLNASTKRKNAYASTMSEMETVEDRR